MSRSRPPRPAAPEAPAGRLTEETLAAGARALAAADPDLARLHRRHGPPPLWERRPGFATLLRIILEQQVSLASARAVWDRLAAALPGVEAEAFAAFDEGDLRTFGFSRQKASYGLGLAAAVAAGELDLVALESLDDDGVRRRLTAIRGLGAWSAEIYLLMALGRPDAWPAGDLALARAAAEVKGLGSPPARDQLEALGEPWRPWRAVAARMLWQYYLSPGRRDGGDPVEEVR